jgi:hypothetical protein
MVGRRTASDRRDGDAWRVYEATAGDAAALNHVWFRFGLMLHRIVSPVILFFVF